MDVFNFVNKQLDLLDLEKNAELEQSKLDDVMNKFPDFNNLSSLNRVIS
jgi:hypothetical protein